MTHRVALLFLLLLVRPAFAEDGRPADGLMLTIGVGTPRVTLAGALRLEARFQNLGDGTMRLFKHLGADHVPSWQLVGSDGRVWAPYEGPRQISVGGGPMGRLLDIASGSTRAFSARFSRVVRADKGAGAHVSYAPQLLPIGRYAIRCTYVREDATVPWWDNGRTTREVDGLWVGRVAADEQTLEVVAPATPYAELVLPDQVARGTGQQLVLAVTNPTARPVSLAGPVAVSVTDWGMDPSRVTYTVTLAAGPLTLAAGATTRLALALDTQVWQTAGGQPAQGRLDQLFGRKEWLQFGATVGARTALNAGVIRTRAR